jgi:hypothetical protein
MFGCQFERGAVRLRKNTLERWRKTARIFRSFEEAERAEREYYAGLTPQERIEIVNELHAKRHPDADQQRLQRVYRVTTPGKC